MALASFLSPADILAQNLRVSSATPMDVQYYNAAAYKRMTQVFNGDQDGMLITTLFPKASIEILLDLEQYWWPNYVTKAAGTRLWTTKLSGRGTGQLMTGFDPTCLVKQNQLLIEVEVFTLVKRFYESLINDNANINEKDKFNYATAAERQRDRWNDLMSVMYFYDVNHDGFISKLEENSDIDSAILDSDRRYF